MHSSKITQEIVEEMSSDTPRCWTVLTVLSIKIGNNLVSITSKYNLKVQTYFEWNTYDIQVIYFTYLVTQKVF